MRLRAEAILLITTALSTPLLAEERRVTLEPAKTHVDFLLSATGHDVNGSFVLSAGEIRFDPGTGAASGEIDVDLLPAATGSKKRDKTMHESVLETQTWPAAVFHPRRIEGLPAKDGTSDVSIDGVLTFHGADHPLTMKGQVTLAGSRAALDARFEIPFVEWGLHDPSILFLRVAKTVQVHVVTEGEVAEPARAAVTR